MAEQTTFNEMGANGREEGAGQSATRNEDGAVTHPPDALTFRISGPWAHFKRIDGNVVKQTYRIPPRTTIAGLLAAILGIGRDEYYDTFGKGESAIAVEPLTTLRTMPMGTNGLSTAENEGLKNVNAGNKGPTIVLTDGEHNRQQHVYEVLRNPEYRISVWVSDSGLMDELEHMLLNGKSVYTPTLGLSEYIASISYEGRFSVDRYDGDTPADIDSAVPDGPARMQVGADATYHTERSPGYMAVTNQTTTGRTRRKTTEFIDFAYNDDGGTVTVLDADDVAVIDGRNIVFR